MSERLRIAVISRNFSRTGGGAESYSVAIVQELIRSHEIHVFAQRTDQPVAGVRYHRVLCLSEKPRWVNQFCFAVATWWRTRRGFDVVHSHENSWHGQVQTIHVRPTRFNLLTGRSGWRLALRWLKVLSSPRLLTYVLLERARFKPRKHRRIVATSQALAEQCSQAYPDCTAILSVITPGTAVPADKPSQQQARVQLGLPQDRPLLLFVANDYARKGLDVLLQALLRLSAGVHLAVAGGAGQIALYQPVVKQMGLTGRVHFLGPQTDLTPAYCSADCLAHPTLEDSFAMVVLEAMAHGLPVVVSGPAYCGISAHLQHGHTAMLLPQPQDAQALAALLQRMLTDPPLARQISSNGLDFARSHTWQAVGQAHLALYQEILYE